MVVNLKTRVNEGLEDSIQYFAKLAFESYTLEEMLWDLMDNCLSKLPLEYSVIYMLDDQYRRLYPKAAYDLNRRHQKAAVHLPSIIPLGEGIAGQVALSGQGIKWSDAALHAAYFPHGVSGRAVMCVPIKLDHEVLGVLYAEHSERDFFSGYHFCIFHLIGMLCAHRLMWQRTEETIRQRDGEVQKSIAMRMQALRSYMSPRFMMARLQAIQWMMDHKNTFEVLRYITLSGNFIKQVLQSSLRLTLSLAEEVTILNQYLELEQRRYGRPFDYQLTVAADMDTHRVILPVLLIHPFVERTLADGILNREKKGTVQVAFSQQNGYLVSEIKSKEAGGKEGFMNAVYRNQVIQAEPWWEVQERIELLNNLHHTDIQVNLIGTMIEIKIPLMVG